MIDREADGSDSLEVQSSLNFANRGKPLTVGNIGLHAFAFDCRRNRLGSGKFHTGANE